MGDTPLERLRWNMYITTNDIQWMDSVSEDIVINRAKAEYDAINNGKKHEPYFMADLKKNLEDYFEDLLLKPSV